MDEQETVKTLWFGVTEGMALGIISAIVTVSVCIVNGYFSRKNKATSDTISSLKASIDHLNLVIDFLRDEVSRYKSVAECAENEASANKDAAARLTAEIESLRSTVTFHGVAFPRNPQHGFDYSPLCPSCKVAMSPIPGRTYKCTCGREALKEVVKVAQDSYIKWVRENGQNSKSIDE